MSLLQNDVLSALKTIKLPDGSDMVSSGFIKALRIENGVVKFVIEAPNTSMAEAISKYKAQAEKAILAIEGITSVQIVISAHNDNVPQSTKDNKNPASLKIGRHPTEQATGPQKIAGIKHIIAIGSGKGGVGKSTVSSNLAVALARQGWRVGLLDADFYGPSQPKMMGVSKRPRSPDGKMIIPIVAHGVRMMSIGLMLAQDDAIIWRGPMLMGALQQLLAQVTWGELDVLLIDLPPGTGDVQLSLCQKTQLDGAIIVSTPQDVALLDAKKAINMFQKLKTPVLGMIENMSVFHCPNCGYEAHIFGHDGVKNMAQSMGVSLLGVLPLALAVRHAGDDGTPIAATDAPEAAPYLTIASQLIKQFESH